MQDYGLIFTWLSSLHPVVPIVLAALGALVLTAQAIVTMTPSPADNEFMAKLEAIPVLGAVLKGLKSFAPFKKKDE